RPSSAPPPYSTLFRTRPCSFFTLSPYTTLFRSDRRNPRRLHVRRPARLPVAGLPGRVHPGRRLAPLRGPGHAARRLRLPAAGGRSEEHTSELQSRENLVCRLLLEKKKLQ